MHLNKRSGIATATSSNFFNRSSVFWVARVFAQGIRAVAATRPAISLRQQRVAEDDVTVLVRHYIHACCAFYASLLCLAMGNFLRKLKRFDSRFIQSNLTPSEYKKKIVVITGCDSGLGYSLSLKCCQLGLTVVSGCLDPHSEGAKMLSSCCHVHHLDVTDSKSVRLLHNKVENMTRGEFELQAVVNNAGVMIFGEFEWCTEKQIAQQVEVNMLGSFRVGKTFLPLLRKHKGRLINVTSHCALFNLPTLSVYGATKAAVQSWSNGLRLEQSKYGVKVITFIPGSFISQSNILGAQKVQAEEMEREFSSEERQFYAEYFRDFNSYLLHVAGNRKPLAALDDDGLYKKFTEALLHVNPRASYKNEPWRYFWYYNALQWAPFWLQDYIVVKFMKFPQFKGNPT